MVNRFYGTPDLIALATEKGWHHRLRLKGNLLVWIGGQTSPLRRHMSVTLPYLTGVELTYQRIVTNIGIITDPGHSEPWLVESRGSPDIAMSDKRGYLATLDDTARCGMELMFSDFKSRGFGLEQSQLRTPDC